LLESGDLIVLGFDSDGTLIANPRGLRVTGLPDSDTVAEALDGHDRFRTISLHDAPDVRVFTMSIEVNDQVVGAVQIARNQHQLRSAIRAIEVAALAGAAIAALGAFPSGLYLARRAMRPIDRAFRRQQAFIADASHELRTPLAVVRANTELVRRMPDATPQERDAELAVILNEVDRMARLVDELLVLARTDAGRLMLGSDIIDLAAVVRETVAPMRALATDAGLTLKIDAPDELLVKGDEDRLAQVMRILVGNAITYTPPGGTIRVDSGLGAAVSASVTIADTGIGMSAAERAQVFDRFYRGEQSRSRGTGGVGLGLPIAQAIIQAHGGVITLESESGKGTTVRVALPHAVVSRQP
jgi:signal transduction histidine kinase